MHHSFCIYTRNATTKLDRMADDEPPRCPPHSNAGNSRRIAPENISSTPQTQPCPLPQKNPYPFTRPTSADENDDPDDDDTVSSDGNHCTEETPQRRMWQIANRFFERRTNGEATGATSDYRVDNEPSDQHMHLVPHPTSRFLNWSTISQDERVITCVRYNPSRRLCLVGYPAYLPQSGVIGNIAAAVGTKLLIRKRSRRYCKYLVSYSSQN